MSIGKYIALSLVAGTGAYALMFAWGLDMGLGDWRAWVLLGLTGVALVGLGYGVIGLIKETKQ